MPEQPGDGGLGYSWFAIDVVSEYVDPGTPPPPDIESGGGKGDHIIGGPLGKQFRQEIPLEVALGHPTVVRVAAFVELARNVSLEFPLETVFGRPVQLSFPAIRESSKILGRIAAEDELLLLLAD